MPSLSPAHPANDGVAQRLVPVKRRVRIALVGGFRPTQCGIATFTTDVYEQLSQWLPDHDIDVYAMVREPGLPVGAEATAHIHQHDVTSYRRAAERMNRNGVDAIWIQHEFGIFGGEFGEYVLEILENAAAPIIVTLHTVLAEPNDKQRAIIDRMRVKATRLVVMSNSGKDILQRVYGIKPSQIHIIEHGAPDRPHTIRGALGSPVIMTFGLLGPGKGLETAIRALPEIRRVNPDAIYRIVGATHPNLVAVEGESYRTSLKLLARELGVENAVQWVERFLDTEELLEELGATDIYLTPYLNLAQSTSGTLSYAVALGCAVVSTPYVHARELLADGVGRLVEPNSPQAIATAVNALLEDRDVLHDLRSKAYERGRSTVWSQFARNCGNIIGEVLPRPRIDRAAIHQPSMPAVHAVLRMIDDVGMLQHCCGIVPDRNHGYSIDDNARALILMNEWGKDYQKTAIVLAAFLQHAWNGEERRFRNFMGFDRRWLEKAGSDDSNGRALWAIGHTAQSACDPRFRDWATALWRQTAPELRNITAPRAMAFMVLGADQMLRSDPGNATARELIDICAERFARMPLNGRCGDWCWLEPGITYDNARIPQALLILSQWTGRKDLLSAGLAQLGWLIRLHTTAKGQFRPVGSESFQLENSTRPFDQQPVEAWAMIDACAKAFEMGLDGNWRDVAQRAYAWYLGHNDRGIAVADPATGECFDGLTATGVNTNSGAESLVSFSLAYQSLMRMAGGAASHVETRDNSRAKGLLN